MKLIKTLPMWLKHQTIYMGHKRFVQYLEQKKLIKTFNKGYI